MKGGINLSKIINSAFTIGGIDYGPSKSNQNLPDVVYKYFSIPTKNRDFNKRIKQLLNGQLWFSYRHNLNDPMDLLLMDTTGLTEELKDYYIESTKNKVYACFSDSDVNSLMWAHYASAFRGFCIGFNVAKINKDIASLHKVDYVDNMLAIQEDYKRFHDFKNSGGLEKACKGKTDCFLNYKVYQTVENASAFLYSKTNEWSYENEHRIIINDNNEAVAKKFKGGCLIDLNKLNISILSITFGLNCPQKVIDKFNKYRENLSNEGFNIELKTLEYDGVKLKTKERG